MLMVKNDFESSAYQVSAKIHYGEFLCGITLDTHMQYD